MLRKRHFWIFQFDVFGKGGENNTKPVVSVFLFLKRGGGGKNEGKIS